MDDIVFYQPPPTSRSQPLRFPGTVTASHLSPGPFVSLSACKIPTFVSKKTHYSDQYSRNDKQDSTASRSLPNRSDDNSDDDFPDMEEILSGTWQKSMPASEDLNIDDPNGFIDIDEVLSGVQQKGQTSEDSDFIRTVVDMVEGRPRGGSPTGSSRSTAGSSRDPIILSDDEAVRAESETDYSNLEFDLPASSDSSSPHIADSNILDSEGFGFDTAYVSDRLVADHQDDSNDRGSGVAHGARLQLAADLPRPAFRGHSSSTHQASPIQLTQGSTSYDGLSVTKEVEEEGIDVLADDQVDVDTCSTKKPPSSIDSPASDNNIFLSELPDSQHDSTGTHQPGSAGASHHQSDLTNDCLPRHRRRRDETENVCRKRLRMPSLTRSPSTTSTISAALDSNDFERTQSVALLMAPAKEREIHDTGYDMVDDGGTDDSSDEDYDDMSSAAAPKIRFPTRSQKRVKRAKDMEHNDVGTPSTRSAHSLNVSYQATAATSSVSMQESEEIPIHGCLTLKTIDSKVVYCLTFSQELLQEPGEISQRPGIPRSVSSSRDRRDSGRLPVQERDLSRPAKNLRFSANDDELLRQLKGEGLSWDEISDRFPERSKGTLQVHYSTKLKPRSETSKNAKKRRRFG
ncbi:uncharacterized protein RAG0_13662 [Rhynchosporium agropyri]|uniref:Myb-like domain-containing protein n=1 Tax=Rhynchosporium agropyri TaxID=914238 RepID=A0A1E1LDQ9_9HELO|nr:uncharacterized protein RAG0_13662 [Rhynchosporium agropyri]